MGHTEGGIVSGDWVEAAGPQAGVGSGQEHVQLQCGMSGLVGIKESRPDVGYQFVL